MDNPDLVQTIKPPPTGQSTASQRSTRSRRSAAASSAGREVLRAGSVPSLPLDNMRPAPKRADMVQSACNVPLGHLPAVNVPGYTGFIPGKASESILGATHTRSNALALVACSRRGEPEEYNDFARRTSPYGLLLKRRGASVPGYRGYIPGKHPSNVFGSTFADSNATAMEVCREMALDRQHRAPSATLAAPTSFAGNRPAYVITRWADDN
mmetsp:Transcript_14232/g.30538  ORF Transcript_14232/g.30538 Transcript_14232/m.30538 type:complete len:211 (-) Transcript_14232:53-685(-)